MLRLWTGRNARSVVSSVNEDQVAHQNYSNAHNRFMSPE
jgi:hypothetical protein